MCIQISFHFLLYAYLNYVFVGEWGWVVGGTCINVCMTPHHVLHYIFVFRIVPFMFILLVFYFFLCCCSCKFIFGPRMIVNPPSEENDLLLRQAWLRFNHPLVPFIGNAAQMPPPVVAAWYVIEIYIHI